MRILTFLSSGLRTIHLLILFRHIIFSAQVIGHLAYGLVNFVVQAAQKEVNMSQFDFTCVGGRAA